MPFIVATVNAIGASIVSGALALGIGYGGALAVSSAVLKIAGSYLLNLAASALMGRAPSAQDVGRELAQATTSPAYRFVYGECRATGTPAGTPIKGNFIYGVWILNSRVSDLSDFDLYLDKRHVKLTGDAFDFAGSGATATESPFENHVTAWVGLGDQVAPPAAFTDDAPFVSETAEHLWKTTDGWRGLTVIFLRLKAGSNGSRAERWPSVPPLVEVEGKWSKVYDPRDAAQSEDDETTWAWSETHPLCVRDALTQNPIRQYQSDQLHSSFFDADSECDEIISLKSGGQEARYTCAGTILFSDGEIEDLLIPMMVSAAADFIRVGGKLGYASGVYRAPTVRLDYLLGDGFQFPDMVPGDQLVNQLRVSYLSSSRGYQTADLQPWDIPGALEADGGLAAVKTLDLPFCASATQAMRVRKIIGLRLRRQEKIIGGTLPPEAFDLIGGATAEIALPSPYDALDGVYEIGSIHPGLDPIGESGEVAMRLPASLTKHSADIYAWTPATDEEDIFDEFYDDTRTGILPPGEISITTGEAVNQDVGGTIIPRILFAVAPSLSTGVSSYEWEYRQDGGDYTTGGYIDGEVRDGSDNVFGYLTGVSGQLYDLRVRALAAGAHSDWVDISGITPVVALDLDLPIDGAAIGGAGEITVTFTTPNDADFKAIEFYGADTDNGAAASLLGSAIYTSPNTLVSVTEIDLAASTTRFYFARSRGDYASASALTASVTATTDP
ncbi:MAG: phage tail protein [Litorimonas sp.]